MHGGACSGFGDDDGITALSQLFSFEKTDNLANPPFGAIVRLVAE